MIGLQELNALFYEDRPTMDADNTTESLFWLLSMEVYELYETLKKPEEMALELADVVVFALAMADKNGIDLEEEIRTKMARNLCKYPHQEFKDGDHKEAKNKCRQRWKELGGDEEFYK